MTAPIERLPLNSVKKFYFFRYFRILLECVEREDDRISIFAHFVVLKQKYQLGDSKYRRNISENELLTEKQFIKYEYTFNQVVTEAREYRLVKETVAGDLTLLPNGLTLLKLFREVGEAASNRYLLGLMEERYEAFRYLIEFLYQANRFKKGLLVLPSYRPSQLGIQKDAIRTGNDLVDYLHQLTERFRHDFKQYLGNTTQNSLSELALNNQIQRLLTRLRDAGLFPEDLKEKFSIEKYNSVTKRIRDFWITYFLQEVYGYKYSMASFDIWTYRAKQVDIIHATEFYPNVSGRVVYPTALIINQTASDDFVKIYEYSDGKKLFSHEPSQEVEENQDTFIKHLYDAYVDLRRTNRSYFINLPPLREIVCYNMKISERLFELFLARAYNDNLEGKLKVSISLEVDRLPEETKAMYLKQEPVVINGKYKNIIAIDIAKGET